MKVESEKVTPEQQALIDEYTRAQTSREQLPKGDRALPHSALVGYNRRAPLRPWGRVIILDRNEANDRVLVCPGRETTVASWNK